MNEKASFRKHSLRMNILIAVISLLALITISLSYYHYNSQMQKSLIKRAESDLIQSSGTVTNQIRMDLETINQMLHKLALPLEYSSSENYDLLSFRIMLSAQSSKNNLGSLSFYTRDMLSESLKDSASGETEEKEDMRRLLKGEDIISFTPEDPMKMITFFVPVIRKNQVIGGIKNVYSEESVQKLLAYPTFDNQGSAIILKATGEALIKPEAGKSNNIFVRLKNARFFSGSSLEQLKEDLSGQRSGFLHYSFEGNRPPVYSYYSPIGMKGLYLYNIIPASLVDTEAMRFSRLANSLIAIIILVFIALIILILVMQIINGRSYAKSQEHLLLERERYHTILRHSHGTIWEYYHETDTMVKSDPDVGIYSGMSVLPHFKDTLLKKDLIKREDIPVWEQFYHDLISGIPEINYELRAKNIDGNYVWFSLSAITVYDKNNQPVSAIGQTLNIDNQKRQYEELRDSSRRDALTKLYNRLATEELVNEAISHADPSALYAFIMIDIDDFKNINDSYGHIFGDAVLIEFSSKLSKNFCGKSIVGRLGGDEFAVFLCGIPSLSYLREMAEKICHIFSNIDIEEDGENAVSGSIGIALFPQDGKTFDDLLQKADVALYRSKSLGKNCYHIYSSETMSSIVHPLKIKEIAHEPAYSHEDHSLIDSSIIANTVEILFDARQFNISIQMILSLIGNYYDLGFLTIFEATGDGKTLDVTYEWVSENGRGFMDKFPRIPMDIAKEYMFYKSTPTGLFYTNDALPLADRRTPVSDYLRSMQIKCILQCAIYSQDTREGLICAGIFDQERSWAKPEVDSLSLLAKIIGAHILKYRMEQAAEQIALKDPLTGVYNFFPFVEEASRLVSENLSQEYIAAYIDINRFKFINETFGYSEGDRVLTSLARILEQMTDSSELVGRVSGDKFVALLKYESKPSFLHRLRQAVHQLNSSGQSDTVSHSYRLTLIFGLSFITDRNNMSVNIDRANIARKSITDRHRTSFAFFDESMKSRLLKQKEIEDVMEDALKKGEFIVYYQPKFDLMTEALCGAEALVRWNRPGSGLVSPDEFIPIFEENGFIVDLDYYVFDQVCREIRSLLDAEKLVVPISVNFSRIHLKNRSLLPHLLSTIRDYDIPASLLEIEITESALVDDDGYLITLLNEIHDNGFRLCMDDFGSGLSSLNLLRIFPFDVLKIDREFFQEGSSTARERIVITNIVKMASELNMAIVSEGVESKEQVDFLKSIHCHVAQGFYFERPLPEERFEEQYCMPKSGS